MNISVCASVSVYLCLSVCLSVCLCLCLCVCPCSVYIRLSVCVWPAVDLCVVSLRRRETRHSKPQNPSFPAPSPEPQAHEILHSSMTPLTYGPKSPKNAQHPEAEKIIGRGTAPFRWVDSSGASSVTGSRRPRSPENLGLRGKVSELRTQSCH